MEAKVETLLADMLEGEMSKKLPANPDVLGTDTEYIPIQNKTVGYIVAGVLLNSHNHSEVLLIQESRDGMKGSWYLPAGKLKPGESFQDGAKRLVHKETGYKFEPTSLTSVEACSGGWYRLTFTGKITGGQLKTRDLHDEGSIQARWFPLSSIREQKILTLRSEDIVPVIEASHRYFSGFGVPHHPITITKKAYRDITFRMVLINIVGGLRNMRVLVDTKDGAHFPTGVVNRGDYWLHQSKDRIIQSIFSTVDMRTETVGVLAVEHDSTDKQDGMCLTCLVITCDDKPLVHGNHSWLQLADGKLKFHLEQLMDPGNIIPLMDIL